ncbi:hypothetical protein [Actinacidiphila yeochonensis]|uniref:hypothetical protein n=1 Tax=Actinacidiphila yeochonensis TaxID=89050 RepID=UPI000559CE9F|nr:hypothetical protein [Actinacidiphila yeochonensis]
MSNGDFPFFIIAAVVIFAITAAVVVYCINQLASTPVRLVAVIGAVASLLTALATLISAVNPTNERTIDQPPPTAVTSCVAPVTVCATITSVAPRD